MYTKVHTKAVHIAVDYSYVPKAAGRGSLVISNLLCVLATHDNTRMASRTFNLLDLMVIRFYLVDISRFF